MKDDLNKLLSSFFDEAKDKLVDEIAKTVKPVGEDEIKALVDTEAAIIEEKVISAVKQALVTFLSTVERKIAKVGETVRNEALEVIKDIPEMTSITRDMAVIRTRMDTLKGEVSAIFKWLEGVRKVADELGSALSFDRRLIMTNKPGGSQ